MAVTEPRVIEGFDPLTDFQSPEHRADPHALYHRLREEAPILFVPQWDELILLRHADCEAVLRDPRFSSNPQHRRLELPVEDQDVRTQLSSSDVNVLLFIDPPDHTRIRRLVSQAFTPRRVEELRSHIQVIVDGLLDVGYELPVTVICEMLGVPKEDRHLFHEWSSGATRLLDGVIPPEDLMPALGGAMQIINYLNGIIERRRRSPGDDLLSALIAAEEEGQTLTEEELRSTALLLFVAGHETTMNLIGNGMAALLRHPDQLQRLRDDPGLIQSAIEELLRFDGPVHLTGRIATEDLDVAGVTILVAHDRKDRRLPAAIARSRPNVLVVGHSHQPLLVQDGDLLVVNPGSAGPRRFRLPRTAGTMTLVRGWSPRVSLWDLDRDARYPLALSRREVAIGP